MIKQKENESRLEYLLRVSIFYMQHHIGSIRYDETECDSLCLADDLENELEDLKVKDKIADLIELTDGSSKSLLMLRNTFYNSPDVDFANKIITACNTELDKLTSSWQVITYWPKKLVLRNPENISIKTCNSKKEAKHFVKEVTNLGYNGEKIYFPFKSEIRPIYID